MKTTIIRYRTAILLMLTLWAWAAASVHAQQNYRVQCFDIMTSDILDMRTIVQDARGFIWVSSSNGIYRFDGMKMQNFRPKASDNTGVSTYSVKEMTTDRDGRIWCLMDGKPLVMNVHTYRFTNILEPLARKTRRSLTVRNLFMGPKTTLYMICTDNTVIQCDTRRPEQTITVTRSVTPKQLRERYWQRQPFVLHDRYGNVWTRDNIDSPGIKTAEEIFADNQDNIWYIDRNCLYKVSFRPTLYREVATETDAMRWATRDRKGRLWVSSRSTQPLSIYNADNSLLGYLTPSGSITKTLCGFSSRVYVTFEDTKGTVWLGTKPDGLYRLTPTKDGAYTVTHFTKAPGGLNSNDIIDILEDAEGRIWTTGFHEGLCCITSPHAPQPRFTAIPVLSKGEVKFRRSIYLRRGAILSATSAGLAVYDLRHGLSPLLSGTAIHRHSHEPEREASLSSFALKTVLETKSGEILVCTRDAGIDIMNGSDIFATTLAFKHVNKDNGFPSDYVKSIVEHKGHLWVTAQNKIIEWNPKGSLPESAEVRLTLEKNNFSESNPARRADGSFVYGVMNGMIAVSLDTLSAIYDIEPETYPIVITSMEDRDTITLDSDNRTLNLTFATLDYDAPERIAYAVRLTDSDGKGEWLYMGNTQTISFYDLNAGEYTLELRSTDSNGRWLDNKRQIKVNVHPALWETWWMRTIYIILVIALIAAVWSVRRYITAIKRQQHETLEAYMQLVNASRARDEKEDRQNEEYRQRMIERVKVEPQSDAMIKKVVEFIDMHIDNSDIDVEQMAQYAAVSRSQLNHKLKQLMGVTPSEMIREARIKRACKLLKETSMSVNEIAYRCGFTDPKYFSKTFKATKGCSPTAYRVNY